MKKTVALAILGVAATSAFGQGHVFIQSYAIVPYNQITWGAEWQDARANTAVVDATVDLQVWYGAGTLADDSTLVEGMTFHVNPGITYNGGGFYDPIVQVVPDAGTYTFQFRAMDGTGPIDEARSRSTLFTFDAVSTSLPPQQATVDPVPGLTIMPLIPEPSTLALAGLGAAALLLFRRRA